ncbi:uncharacterized protein L969DRAFT_69651 [Mixia osmundae IAM 14324]|uniref:Eukaryotic translation initiation factor 3 subunit D n=1 Tax=Mixia osmundae (strain CBS 9802 / IAM 14324 / JCM 22182 / KY 12970) TaxID=764103 RepID=G7E311_MIXOS|nr:uncharacterized protein L969DRAFT_69651 [Mixia osmundae IAM 14324]KEI42519.1 hypothetical protein L969DRAFT_69651 [Mixia osmundae IAM 14324]GAA97192.1 hypothetical protein E5Q_03868 [Mixia osmundae IAM 14324]
MPGFVLPPLADSADHFGPSSSALPTKFADIPFQSYSKSDRVGTIVEWANAASAPAAYQGGGYDRSNAGSRRQREAYGDTSGMGSYKEYQNDEDEASFSLVDGGASARAKATAGQQGGNSFAGGARGGFRGRGGYRPYRGGAAVGGRGGYPANATGRGGYQQRGGFRGGMRGGSRGGWVNGRWEQQRTRESSVHIGQDWIVLEEIEFARLSKLRLDVDTSDADTLSSYGAVYEYDKQYDRINTKNERPLQPTVRVRYNPSASEDPVLQEIANSNRAQVFATDTVLSMLMCSTRSLYPWDLILVRKEDKLFLDKREQGPLDYLTVNENASDPPMENERDGGINTPAALAQEATFLNDNFASQVVKEDEASRVDMDHPNPFHNPDEPEPLASCGYRYRKFDLSVTENEDIQLVVRTEVDTILKASGTEGDQYINTRTLFEFDSRAQGAGGAPDWRSKLDAQRGAVIATEMKNNSCKLARWAVQSILAGAEQIKMGYVARGNPKDPNRHVILGSQWFKSKDFAAQLNVNVANGWGIVRTVVDLCLKQNEGKYVLLKDPNKPVIRLYSVPLDAFEQTENIEDIGEESAHDDDDY